ncbi:unnamed protein product [Heligmosomoides polygyrus]|uniref:C-type lectin domain-containing protein n=1 Tax=Heligmosomoides polygyrus TaxID=6339 RepID=A0A183F298_HELPZ|nr:unnamed protein product [Heligmosomoides polygyrus]
MIKSHLRAVDGGHHGYSRVCHFISRPPPSEQRSSFRWTWEILLTGGAHQSAAEFNETLLQKAENGEWIIPASDKKMYKIIYIEQPSSPVSAEKLCDTENAHLASVHSEDENLLLYGETTTSCQFDLLWAFDVPDLLEELATRRNPKAIQYAYIGLYQKIVLYSRLYKYRDFYKGWAALGCETKGPSNYAVCQK